MGLILLRNTDTNRPNSLCGCPCGRIAWAWVFGSLEGHLSLHGHRQRFRLNNCRIQAEKGVYCFSRFCRSGFSRDRDFIGPEGPPLYSRASVGNLFEKVDSSKSSKVSNQTRGFLGRLYSLVMFRLSGLNHPRFPPTAPVQQCLTSCQFCPQTKCVSG